MRWLKVKITLLCSVGESNDQVPGLAQDLATAESDLTNRRPLRSLWGFASPYPKAPHTYKARGTKALISK